MTPAVKEVNRREFLMGATATAAALTGLTGCPSQELPHEPPPNLLFILVDQLRYDALSCAGSLCLDTPNLDRLASEGTRFETAWCPSSICAPSRTSILTGEPIHSHQAITNLQVMAGEMRAGLTSFDNTLRAAGFATDYRGRWHAPPQLLDYDSIPWVNHVEEYYKAYLLATLGDPPAPLPGQYTNAASGWPYTPDVVDHNYRADTLANPAPNGSGTARYGVDAVPAEHSMAAVVTDDALAALERMQGAPFALTASYLQPHMPLYVPEPYASAVHAADMVPSPTLELPPLNTCYESGYDWVYDDHERHNIQLIMARYYALVKEIDDQVGRILDTLERLGLASNTLVVFTADHGEMLGDHGLYQKYVAYEASLRVPLIMRLPGIIPEGQLIQTPVSLIDLHATILDYLGQAPVTRTSASLRSLIQGTAVSTELPVTSQFKDWTIAIQEGQWKYVWSNDATDPDMLFDLNADPLETTNLLGAYPQRANYVVEGQYMKDLLCAWLAETQHPWLEHVNQTDLR